MVDVRVVWVRVCHPRVTVPVFMRLLSVPGDVVAMPVVLIVNVPVGMIEFFMQVFVFMALSQVKPDPQRHQATGQPEPRTGVFTQQDQREHRARKRGGRKIGSGARRSQATKRQHEHHQADPVAQQPDNHRRRRGA